MIISRCFLGIDNNWWEFLVGMELGSLFEDGFEGASTGQWDSVAGPDAY